MNFSERDTSSKLLYPKFSPINKYASSLKSNEEIAFYQVGE